MGKETFKLIKLLGSGMFGQTYLVEVLDAKNREKWGKEVVIKIPRNKKTEKFLISDLIINASLDLSLGNVETPNIIRYLGFDIYDDKYVVVMEYVKGYSLRKKMGNEKISIEKALSITKQVCKGLSELHKLHLLHRDIKPENIILCENTEIAKISDFWNATLIKSTEHIISGTVPYMPKELLNGTGGSFYSDVYSTGVTLYEMLTGQWPFGNLEMNMTDLIDSICNQKPTPPMSVNSAIDEKLNAIILKSIEKDINKRYQSAEEFLKAIEGYEQGIDYEEVKAKCADKEEITTGESIKEAKNFLTK